MPEMNKVYVLNPHYHLRHDIHRVALFSSAGTDTDCSRNWHTFIHPLQAVMLSFFTYDRPLQTTLPLLCDFFCRLQAEKLLLLTDTKGIYRDFEDKSSFISTLTQSEAKKLINDGSIGGGFISPICRSHQW